MGESARRDEGFEIFCPKCGWRPAPEDRWQCEPACGTVWNTFWTRGMCPGCGKQWGDTQCLACQKFSPHQHWYHQPDRERSDDEMPVEPEEIGQA